MNICKLSDKVFSFTSQKALFFAPCHVIVGVSGGADSMALLHCLLHWPEEGLRLTVVHVHHGLRGETADRDARFVKEYCEEQGVPCVVQYVDAAAFAEAHQCSLEDAGRRLRYALFEDVRRDVDADYVLTAHTADDQAETVLMRLIRGSGVDGLVGIAPVRNAVRRPLLSCTRADIEAYCVENAVPFVEDETNADVTFTRNRIRHEILPLLREVNPSVDKALVRLSGHAAEDSGYLRDQARELLSTALREDGFDAAIIASQPSPVRRRALALMMMDAGIATYDETHILSAEQMLLSGCGTVCLPNELMMDVRQGRVYVFGREDFAAYPVTLSVQTLPCAHRWYNNPFVIELSTDQNVHKLFANAVIDYDTIQGGLCVRCRSEGDYMHPAARNIGKSLKKLMNEWHIPAHLRDTYPILCDDVGVVLVPGYGCDERVRPTDDTKHFLVWRFDAEQG